MSEPDREAAALAERISEAAARQGISLAVAESLTAGKLAAALGAAPDSATWFTGGVVAYSEQVKRHVLGVPDVPVVSRDAAVAMALGVRVLLGARVAVAVTGVGGPGPQDGEPAGSVWFAVATGTDVTAWHHRFDGDPEQILEQTVRCALDRVAATLC